MDSVLFKPATNYRVGNQPRNVVVADFNEDKFLDIAVGNGNADDKGKSDVSLLLGFGDGNFTDELTYNDRAGAAAIATADFNKDKLPDIAFLDRFGVAAILKSSGDGEFTEISTVATIPSEFGDIPTDLVVEDFNGDEMPDVVVAHFLGTNNPSLNSYLSVLLNNGDGTLKEAGNFVEVGKYAAAIASGDFDGDGEPDLAVANAGSGNISVVLGNGDGTFGDAQNIDVGEDPRALAVGDFNGDNKPDLVVAKAGEGTVDVLLNKGGGTFGNAVKVADVEEVNRVIVGDFNGDDIADIAVRTRVFLGKGDGTFEADAKLPDKGVPGAAADLNDDGQQDLILTKIEDNEISVLLNVTKEKVQKVIKGTPKGERLDAPYELNTYILGFGGNDNIVSYDGDDTLNGGSGNDSLRGGPGDDSLLGGEGNDYLSGGHDQQSDTGQNTLDGGQGNDFLYGSDRETLIGGEGDDIYQLVIPDAVAGSIIEDTDGEDTLELFYGKIELSIGLEADTTGVEKDGTDLIVDLNQDGKTVAKDDLTIKNFFDESGTKAGIGLIENLNNLSGSDIIKALAKNKPEPKGEIVGTQESDRLSGSNDSDTIEGLKGRDTLEGLGGDDILDGGKGNDILTGGGGKDKFLFNTKRPFRSRDVGVDTIEDFILGEDKIVLDRTTFKKIKGRALQERDFEIVDRLADAKNSDAFIVYNEKTGDLFYNANGSKRGFGSGGLFARLEGSPELTADDFLVQR